MSDFHDIIITIPALRADSLTSSGVASVRSPTPTNIPLTVCDRMSSITSSIMFKNIFSAQDISTIWSDRTRAEHYPSTGGSGYHTPQCRIPNKHFLQRRQQRRFRTAQKRDGENRVSSVRSRQADRASCKCEKARMRRVVPLWCDNAGRL
ncbi:hypothetical protein PAXRUDRAFT_268912 [Paxillus rubicundulus Ve08.2h10]|uniref:Uncharacterized protein n=1 Tax=Paxillus rubicundulus Ve08.2h10 TaxID=930991 RepID=A0A0D0DGC5_9AGAM|nr:hypothetical protein PAXRUDRAFT_268912 [Paxillus rubicundulus Ve08.2h10]